MSGEPNELTIYDRFDHPGEMIEQLGKAILHSKMFGCENASQGQVIALECASRRCPPVALAERYHIIHGRLSMRADAMLADFTGKHNGVHRVVSRTPDKAAIELTIRGESQVFLLTWEEAKAEPFVYVGKEADVAQKLQAGSTSSLHLKAKYATPRSRMQMLWARVVSDGVRTMAPEVVAGHYTPEELEDALGSATSDKTSSDEIDAEFVVVDEPAGKPADTPPPKKKSGVKLDGKKKVDPYSQTDNDPCGEVIAKRIISAAQALGMPPEKLRELVSRCGVFKVSEMPMREAEKLMVKMEARMTEDEIPF